MSSLAPPLPAPSAIAPPAPGRSCAPNPRPALARVAWEELRAVGLSLRWEAAAGAVLLGATIVSDSASITVDRGMPITPAFAYPAVAAAPLVAAAVWKRRPAAQAYASVMPLDPVVHALVRTLAGLAWTLLWIAVVMVCFAGLGLVTGGPVLPSVAGWIAPFVGAAVLYLLYGALAIAVRHPWQWVIAALLAYNLAPFAAATLGLQRLAHLLATITMGTGSPEYVVDAPLIAWDCDSPDCMMSIPGWILAAVGWLAVSLLLVALAARRRARLEA
jgi:hypothetical protein